MRLKTIIMLMCGFLALALGGIGILLPILPTTPFVLISAACFASSSPQLYQKLLHTKYFGEFIGNYRNKTGVTRNVKLKGIVFLWAALLISVFVFPTLMVRTILLVVGICVSVHICLLKGKN